MDCHDADLPADPEFRATLVGCLKWGTRLTGPGALRAVTSAGLYHSVPAPLGFRLATVLRAGAILFGLTPVSFGFFVRRFAMKIGDVRLPSVVHILPAGGGLVLCLR
jgi:hypothetical protein